MDTVALGKRIATLRDGRGWSRDELADKAKLHPNTIRNVELGADSMQVRTLDAIAKVFGIELTELLGAKARRAKKAV